MPLLRRVGLATWQVVRDTFREWFEDNAPMFGAALAFYSIFSLAPLLVIAIGVAGLAFGREAVQAQVLSEFANLLGREGATQVETVLRNAAVMVGVAGPAALAGSCAAPQPAPSPPPPAPVA